MKLNQRFLSVSLASVIGLGALAPMALADDHSRRDTTIALGAASIALLATNHRDAGLVGLGLTAFAAGLFDDHREHRYHDGDRYDRRDDRDYRDYRLDVRWNHDSDDRWRNDDRRDRDFRRSDNRRGDWGRDERRGDSNRDRGHDRRG